MAKKAAKKVKQVPSRGGFRENSGRKSLYENPVTRSFVLPGALLEQLKEIAGSEGGTVNSVVVTVLQSFADGKIDRD
jgi:hypothetical protein